MGLVLAEGTVVGDAVQAVLTTFTRHGFAAAAVIGHCAAAPTPGLLVR